MSHRERVLQSKGEICVMNSRNNTFESNLVFLIFHVAKYIFVR